MIHPATELRHISAEIGSGVFATAHLPKGTIVYVKDLFEIELSRDAFEALDEYHRAVADKYSYVDQRGVRVLSWDLAKYVNHRCDSNTMSTGYGFEVATRDIAPGEEITDEYGLFNLDEEMALGCNCPNCRRVLRPDDIDSYHAVWDARLRDALRDTARVPQPLWPFIDDETREDLVGYLEGRRPYRSVLSLKWVRESAVATR